MEKTVLLPQESYTVSEETPLKRTFKRTSSIKVELDDSRRGNLISKIRLSSSNLIHTSVKKQSNEDLNLLKEYLRNENLLEEEKNGAFEEFYSEVSILGEGTSSVVKKCTEKRTNKTYAVKIMRTNDLEKINQAKNEFYNLKGVDSEYIIKAYELFYNPRKGRLWTLMEYDEDIGELTELVESEGFFNEELAKSIFKMLVEGVLTLHKSGLCHRDLKPDNILVDFLGSKLKIIDFNISKKKDILSYDGKSKKNMTMLTHFGTLNFSAPEMIQGYSQYSEQVDMWSSGSILYFMLSGQLPFQGANLKCIVERISKGECFMTDSIWNFISDNAKDLISKLIQVDPQRRLSAYEVLQHPWLVEESNTPPQRIFDSNKIFSHRQYFTDNQQDRCTYINYQTEGGRTNNKNPHVQRKSNHYFTYHYSIIKFRSKSSDSLLRPRIELYSN